MRLRASSGNTIESRKGSAMASASTKTTASRRLSGLGRSLNAGGSAFTPTTETNTVPSQGECIATGSTKCDPCDPGEGSERGSAKCQVCEAGMYSKGIGNCTNCDPGQYRNTSMASVKCIEFSKTFKFIFSVYFTL